MSALSQSRSTSNITRMRQLFEGGTTSSHNQPIPLSRCRSEVITTRGFKPSDIKDPAKTRILHDLTYKIWGRNMDSTTTTTTAIENGVPQTIDLQKLFTPASDAPEIQPRNKKMFASSSFYGPNHPTMEEQVELARRISSSLSDISNKESKGQSMYVNRKKRSVKWVHQGEEQQSISEFSEVTQSENLPPTPKVTEKPALKLVMNPRGQVQDFNSLRHQGIDATPSPEVCFDLVKDLNSPCGKGAELFAKRRKKAEKWVVDESNVKTSQEMSSVTSSYDSYSSHTTTQLGKLATPMLPTGLANLPTPSYLKDVPARFAPTATKNPIPEKYTQPKVRMIKSPWEAALEGSVESAFQDNRSVPSPTPRGHVLIAPSPSALNTMAAPSPPQPQIPSADIYTSRPPKAWHPQPTGKQLSSVKLEQIFEGSPKSPVSLAYHADTNTLSSEPVTVENVPPIAVKLYDYEIIDPSILREPKTRRPDQILAEVEPRNESPSSGAKWPPTGQEHGLPGAVHWSPNAAHWAKQSQQGMKCPPEQTQLASPTPQQVQPSSTQPQFTPRTLQQPKFPPQTAQLPSPTQQRVTWPPLPQYLEDTAPEQPTSQISQLSSQTSGGPQPFIPQPSIEKQSQNAARPNENQRPQQIIQTALETAGLHHEQTMQITSMDTMLKQQAPQFPLQNQVKLAPQPVSIPSQVVQPVIQESSVQNTLQQSLSEIQSAMSQACQNFTRVESSETSNTTQTIQSLRKETEIQSYKSEIISEETKKQEAVQEYKDLTQNTETSLQVEKEVKESLTSNLEASVIKEAVNEQRKMSSNEVGEVMPSANNEAFPVQATEIANEMKIGLGEQAQLENLQTKVNASHEIMDSKVQTEVTESSSTISSNMQVKESSSRKGSIKEILSESDPGTKDSQPNVLIQNKTSEAEPLIVKEPEDKPLTDNIKNQSLVQEEIKPINGFNVDGGNFKSQLEMKNIDAHVQSSQTSSNVSFKKEETSSLKEQIMMTSHSSKSESFMENKQMKESISQVGQNSQLFGSQQINGIKDGGFINVDGISRLGTSQTISSEKFEKSENRTIQQESQYAESGTSRTSMSVMSTTDEEVQDLCEREFNQISMQYEKVTKPEIKKPAAIIPGAVKIFPPGNVTKQVSNGINQQSQNNNPVNTIKEALKKPYKKPASMVPGAKPLFGEAVELHLGPEENVENDRPYEKIPVKNLIKTFEESTRPHMKYKTKTPDTSHFSNVMPDQQTVQQANVQAHLESESQQNIQRTSLYDTYPTENIPSIQGSDIKTQAPVQQDWTQIQVPSSNQINQPSSTPSSIHVDLSNVNNFNTAARGWQSNMSYYRPVTFVSAPGQYSDF